MYLMDIFTISANLAGIPAMSLPVGLGKDSAMPVGLQLMGPAFCEADMLSVAERLERALPPLSMPEL
jgi:aspartyl-tRNA(Asn)/glutamyl-tRNA(Gln) amidotransferase subunit A